jgi:3-oxoacyl-[acyl-carrier protein] reductase
MHESIVVMHDLRGRRALVCGASKGIGRAVARSLAARGAAIVPLARDAAALHALVDELRSLGAPDVWPLVADLDDREGFSRSVAAELARGPLHIVINNTGGPPGGALTAATEEAMSAALGRHLFASHRLMQAALPGMREAGFGRFVQILSTSVREPIEMLGVSNLTRAAVASWAKTLSRELPAGVTINNVLPGFTDTDRLVGLADTVSARTGQSVDDVRRGWAELAPEGRLGRPEEIAEAVAFLCSPAAAFIRGVSLAVDGGRLRSL